MGNQCTTVDMEPEPLVEYFLNQANELKEKGKLEETIEVLETAKENSTKMHVRNLIDDQISKLEQQIREMPVVAANKKKELSDEDTERFNKDFLKLQEYLSDNKLQPDKKFQLAKEISKTLQRKRILKLLKMLAHILKNLMDKHMRQGRI